MFKTHSGLAHLQQLTVVDQSTLASPGQVAAPKRALLMHARKPREAAIQDQEKRVS